VLSNRQDSAVSQQTLALITIARRSLSRMDRTTPEDRRSAQRRVGAATIATFLILLLLGATHGPAQAESTAPAPATAPSPTAEPNRTQPAVPDGRGFPHDHDGDGGDLHRGGGGFGSDGGGGSGDPAPSTGGNQT
jgi:hypothetical protein